MKSIFHLKSSLINFHKITYPKLSSYLICKNFSMFGRQTTSLNLNASPLLFPFNTNSSNDDKLFFLSIEEIRINNNIIQIEEEYNTSDILNPSDIFEKNKEDNDVIHIELKGRNSKSPKRVNN